MQEPNHRRVDSLHALSFPAHTVYGFTNLETPTMFEPGWQTGPFAKLGDERIYMDSAEEKIIADKVLHAGFDVMLVVKTVLASLELLSGIALFFVAPTLVTDVINLIASIDAGNSIVAPFIESIVKWGSHFSVETQHFWVIYLVLHGVTKLIVLSMLWKRKLWAYPFSVVVFIGFILYQMVTYTETHSIMLIVLSVFDVIMIALTLFEYKRVKQRHLDEEEAGTGDASPDIKR